MARQAALPPTLPPRLISREAAAAYLSVAPGTFDKMVHEGRMPRAKRVSEGRVAWDVRSLDAAIDLLPNDGVPIQSDDSWSDVDAT
jgi:predicted DNA-binding transcriptional regulator AlpA